ncbi:hybrid sensor histidine kinase/response regulator transcription factor [Sphingobacterium sp. UBA5996]|uniref:hybrid sensor histidine kinase/response regulator transcription factor n=1 Tax=Sphingobacterium sp. UBA5996 TaxID=1947505 RepID=UPI0025CDE6A0|nr:two-component regulator propeller domain-containing protein [Sphingobacterium sp. UBA5996]
MKNLLFVVIFLWHLSQVFAQPSRAHFFSIQDGLTNQQVLDLVHDDEGFMWIATELGLNRFAGKAFKSYYALEKPEGLFINSNEINTLLYDNKKVFIGTRANGLNVLDLKTNKFSYYTHDSNNPKSIATNDITDMIKGADGNLWLATYHQGLQYFDITKEEFRCFNKKSLPGLPENSIWSLAEDRNRTLYIGHVNEGVTIFNPISQSSKRLTVQNTNGQLPDNEVKALFCDRFDNIWIGTRKGLAVYSPSTGEIMHIPLAVASKNGNEPFVYTIEEIGNTIWIGAESSQLFLFQPAYGFDQQISGVKELKTMDLGKGNNAMVQRIVADRFGNVWLGLYGGGVGVINHIRPFFNVFPEENTLPDRLATVSNIIVRDSQTIWLTTEGSGIIEMDKDGRLNKQITHKEGSPDDFILTAFSDHNKHVWAGLRKGGVAVRYAGSSAWHEIDLGERVTEVRAIYEDHRGGIWIAGYQGIFIYDPIKHTVEKILINNPMLGDYAPRALVEDGQHNMWVGTYGQGLYIYNSNHQLIRKMDSENGLRNNTINYLLRDRNNNIWVATNQGLALQESQKKIGDLKILSVPGGNAWLFINGLAEDQNGHIWCSTKSGMLRFLPLEKRFLQYDQSFGLPLGGFINGSVGKDLKNRLFFGMQDGICYFDPNEIPSNLPLSPVRVSRFIVFRSGESNTQQDEYPSPKNEINLNYKENSFRVELAVMDVALDGLVEFSYQLQGLNNDWIFLGNETNLDFRNIPYGDHELLIRTRMKNGQWSKTYERLLIKIAPPIYLSLGAKIVYLILILLIVYTLIFFYFKRMKAETELKLKERQHQQDEQLHSERMNFYTRITHELRTPLTLILGPLDDLSHEGELSAKNRSLVQTVQKSANRLFTLVNQLLEFRKVESQFKPLVLESGSLRDLLNDIIHKYKTLNTKPRLQILSDFPEVETRTLFDAEIMQLIVDNLLSNAYKYTDAGYIRLSLKYEETNLANWTVLTVEDTGCGIPAKDIERIFEKFYQISKVGVQGTGIGLALVKELTAIHQGKIGVVSKEGVGTTVSVRFLLNRVVSKKSEEPALSVEESRPSLDPIRPLILLVEDDVDLSEYMVKVLSNHYDVLTAENGAIGFERAQAVVPDLVLSDVMMPDMDGFLLAEKLKAERVTSHIPIILLTARDTDLDRQRGYELGIDSYLTKPIGSMLLLKRIENLLQKQKIMNAVVLQKIKSDNPPELKGEMIEKDNLWRENTFVQDFITIVEEHMQDEVLDAATLAERMNMSQSTLYRKLKGITGKNINQLVRKIRIHKAAELLRSGNHNVTEVSFLVGINSAIYFRQCFKEEFGKLPSEYQKSDGKGK